MIAPTAVAHLYQAEDGSWVEHALDRHCTDVAELAFKFLQFICSKHITQPINMPPVPQSARDRLNVKFIDEFMCHTIIFEFM